MPERYVGTGEHSKMGFWGEISHIPHTWHVSNCLYSFALTYLITYLLTYSLTHSLTPCSRVLLENLTGSQLVKIFPAFYGTRKFITAFTSARHLSLSWASSIQSITLHPTFWRSILIFSSHLRLGLPSGLFPSGFPTKTLYTPLLYPIRATFSAHLILLDFIILFIQPTTKYWGTLIINLVTLQFLSDHVLRGLFLVKIFWTPFSYFHPCRWFLYWMWSHTQRT